MPRIPSVVATELREIPCCTYIAPPSFVRPAKLSLIVSLAASLPSFPLFPFVLSLFFLSSLLHQAQISSSYEFYVWRTHSRNRIATLIRLNISISLFFFSFFFTLRIHSPGFIHRSRMQVASSMSPKGASWQDRVPSWEIGTSSSDYARSRSFSNIARCFPPTVMTKVMSGRLRGAISLRCSLDCKFESGSSLSALLADSKSAWNLNQVDCGRAMTTKLDSTPARVYMRVDERRGSL